MGQQGNHTIGAVGAGHGLQHLGADRLQWLRTQQRWVLLLPAGGGDQTLQRQPQTAAFLQQMGALQEQQALLAAAARLLQRPHLLHQGIAAAADQISGAAVKSAQSGAGECRSSSRCLQG